MKKTLLATTALAALGAVAVAGPAMAAEKIKISVGGYMEQWFGYGSSDVENDSGRSGFDQQSDSEIHFSGKTTLDNGLVVGVNVQLEGETTGDIIDEAYLFVNGSFGQFGMGSENAVAYKMHYGLASHGLGIDEGDGPSWIAGLNSSLNRSSTSAALDNDNNKLWYVTPRVQGLQVGVSFAPNDRQDNDGAPDSNDGVRDNQFSVAANLNRSFGDVKVMLSAGYQDGGSDDAIAGNPKEETISTGMRLGFGGFSVNGVFSTAEIDATDTDQTVYGAGITYAAGPMAISANWLAGEVDVAGNEEKQDLFEVGMKYSLGPGVEAKSSVYFGDNDGGDGGPDKADGMAVAAGLKISF